MRELTNKNRLFFGLNEFITIELIILIISLKLLNQYAIITFYLLNSFYFVILPLFYHGRTVMMILLKIKLINRFNNPINKKEFIVRTILKIICFFLIIEIFKMLILKDSIPYYDKKMKIKLIKENE